MYGAEMGSWTAGTQSSKIEHKMSVRAVLRALRKAGLAGVGGRTGEGSYARGSGFDVGGRPGQALAAVGAPELVAVGPDGQVCGDRDDGEFGGGCGSTAARVGLAPGGGGGKGSGGYIGFSLRAAGERRPARASAARRRGLGDGAARASCLRSLICQAISPRLGAAK